MKKTKFCLYLSLIIVAVCQTILAQIATGDNFKLDQSVVATGGGTTGDAGNNFSLTGSIGQSVAGVNSTNSSISVYGGFFSPVALAPTAANISIGGRVLTPVGAGLRNAIVVLTNSAGETFSARSTTFGYYRFEALPVGGIYVLAVKSKLFTFAPQVVQANDDLTGVNFIALPEN